MQRSHTGASTVMTLLLAARGMRICSSLISPSVLSLHHYTAPVSRRSAASARCCSFLNKCNSNIFPMKQLSSTVSSNRHPAAAPLLLCTYCSTFERSNRGVASIDPPSRGHHGRVSPMWLSAGDVQSRYVQLRNRSLLAVMWRTVLGCFRSACAIGCNDRVITPGNAAPGALPVVAVGLGLALSLLPIEFSSNFCIELYATTVEQVDKLHVPTALTLCQLWSKHDESVEVCQ